MKPVWIPGRVLVSSSFLSYTTGRKSTKRSLRWHNPGRTLELAVIKVLRKLRWTTGNRYNKQSCIKEKPVSLLFDHELCSKVLKEALLLFFLLFLAWNQKQKMFLREQKMLANKICSKSHKKSSKVNKYVRDQKMFAKKICSKSNKKCSQWKLLEIWQKMASLKWQNQSLNFSRPSVALSDLLCSCMAFYGIAWPCIVFYVITVLYGSFIAVIDPNSLVLLFTIMCFCKYPIQQAF